MVLILTKELIFTAIAALVSILMLSFWYGYYKGKKRKEREENQGEAAVRKVLTNYCEKSTAHLLNNVT